MHPLYTDPVPTSEDRVRSLFKEQIDKFPSDHVYYLTLDKTEDNAQYSLRVCDIKDLDKLFEEYKDFSLCVVENPHQLVPRFIKN